MAIYAQRPLSYVHLTIGALVSTLPVPADADSAWLTCDANDIRYRVDGGDPATNEGHIMAAGETLALSGRAILLGLRMIRNAASDAELSVTFFSG
jgi:hypothetical protein